MKVIDFLTKLDTSNTKVYIKDKNKKILAIVRKNEFERGYSFIDILNAEVNNIKYTRDSANIYHPDFFKKEMCYIELNVNLIETEEYKIIMEKK